MITKETWIRAKVAKICDNMFKLNQNQSLKSWFHWMDTVPEWKIYVYFLVIRTKIHSDRMKNIYIFLVIRTKIHSDRMKNIYFFSYKNQDKFFYICESNNFFVHIDCQTKNVSSMVKET